MADKVAAYRLEKNHDELRRLAKGGESPPPDGPAASFAALRQRLRDDVDNAGIGPGTGGLLGPVFEGIGLTFDETGRVLQRIEDALPGLDAKISAAAAVELEQATAALRRIQTQVEVELERQAAAGIDRMVRRAGRLLAAQAVVLAVVGAGVVLALGAAGGYWLGRQVPLATASEAGRLVAERPEWLPLLRHNDPRRCVAYASGGGVACRGNWWLEPPAPK